MQKVVLLTTTLKSIDGEEKVLFMATKCFVEN